MRRIAAERLRKLRNEIDLVLLAERLGLTVTRPAPRPRFHCPLCASPDMAPAPRANIARCFCCDRRFNPIDLVIAVRGCAFLEAIAFLDELLPGR